VYTAVHGVNNAGDAVGEYIGSDYTQHGFLFSGGEFTTIDVPDAPYWTIAYGINDSGEIVGAYSAQPVCNCVDDVSVYGFVYSGGQFSTIDIGLFETRPVAINNNGAIVGYYHDRGGDVEDAERGFLLADGNLTLIDAPGGGPLSQVGTIASGVNDTGTVVGSFYDGTGNHGFRWVDGSLTTVDHPDAPGATWADGINGDGKVVGYYYDGQAYSTYLQASDQFTSISCRDAASTFAGAISDGWIVGSYTDASWNQYSFMMPIAPLALRLTLNAFLPYDNIDDPHPYFGHNRVFEGDGDSRTWAENGSSRTSQIADILNQYLSQQSVFLGQPVDWANITEQYDTLTSLDANGKLTAQAKDDWTRDDTLKTDWGVPVDQADGCSGHSIDSLTVGVTCNEKTPNGVYPAWLDPAIEYHLSMTFGFTASQVVNYSISGCRKSFPAYEVWATGQQIYAGPNSNNPLDIMIPCDSAVAIEKTGTVTIQ
jgi:probable HAF family extracellular repeat protein